MTFGSLMILIILIPSVDSILYGGLMVRVVKCSQYFVHSTQCGDGLPLQGFCFFFFLSLLEPWTVDTCSKEMLLVWWSFVCLCVCLDKIHAMLNFKIVTILSV